MASAEESPPVVEGRGGLAAPRSSILRNVTSGWIITVSGVAYALFITPIVVRTLGQEQYGVWSFINGLMGYSNLLYLGVGSALVKHVAALTATNNLANINRLVSVAITIFGALGVVAAGAFVGVSPWIPELFGGSLSQGTAAAASLASAVLGMQLLCFFMTSGYMAVLLGHDRFDLANLAHLVTIVVRFALVALVLAGDYPLVNLAIFMTVTSAMEFIVVRAMAHRVSRSLRVSIARPRAEELQILYGFGIPAFLITFSVRLISYTDTTVIGVALGASSVGLYALPLQLTEYTRSVIGSYSGVLIARLAGLHAQGDVESLRQTFIRSARIASVLAAFSLSNLIWLGVPFLELWAGPGFGEPVRWVIIWLSLATFLTTSSLVVTLPFFHSMQILAIPVRILFVEALLNLGLSVALARPFGITGVAAATFFPACLTFALLPRLVARRLSVPMTRYVHFTMLPALMVSLAVNLSHWVFSGWGRPASFVDCAVLATASAPAALAALALSMSRNERMRTVSWLRAFGGRMLSRAL